MKVSNVKLEIVTQIFTRKFLFEQWLTKIFFLNDSLNKEYNTIYQDHYYILIYNLLTEGKSHLEQVIESINGCENQYKVQFYDKLHKALLELKSSLKEEEYYYLEYRRHCACHIFQDGYEIIKDNGKIKQERGNVNLVKLHQSLEDIIVRYNGDKGFDLYITKLFYPILSKLYFELSSIHKAESKDPTV